MNEKIENIGPRQKICFLLLKDVQEDPKSWPKKNVDKRRKDSGNVGNVKNDEKSERKVKRKKGNEESSRLSRLSIPTHCHTQEMMNTIIATQSIVLN